MGFLQGIFDNIDSSTTSLINEILGCDHHVSTTKHSGLSQYLSNVDGKAICKMASVTEVKRSDKTRWKSSDVLKILAVSEVCQSIK